MSPMQKRADRLAQIRAQVDYHGSRLVAYRRVHGTRPCQRLTDLEQAYLAARGRLAGASPEPDRAPATVD